MIFINFPRLMLRKCNAFKSIRGLHSHPVKRAEWEVVCALCLERKPIITQPLIPLEQKYSEYIRKLEWERSYFSEHEMRHKEDKRVTEKLKKGDIEETDIISKQTAQDFEDACMEELANFKSSPKVTEADLKNDKKSTQRKLSASLLLTIQKKIGNDFQWVLPQTVHKDGETLKQTLERLWKEISISQAPNMRVMGNAPAAYLKYKYPRDIREDGVVGAHVFIFKAQILNCRQGRVCVDALEIMNDHLWLTHDEVSVVIDPCYSKVLSTFLYPDTVNGYDSCISKHPASDDQELNSSSASC